MKKLLKNSVIKGFVFSIHDRAGPKPVFFFPKAIPDSDIKSYRNRNPNILALTYRDYMQITIKNLSLLLSDGVLPTKDKGKKLKYFAIIPYPDFSLISLTFFHFLTIKPHETPIETAFSILIDDNRRNFLYNNHSIIKERIEKFFQNFDERLSISLIKEEEGLFHFKKLISELVEIEGKPNSLDLTQRKMKIILAGLDDSGKTSYILTIDRKFSKLIGLKPTSGASVQSIQALGASLFLWDLGGQYQFRQKYLSKSNIYLYESDLIFYFIDIKNEERFQESLHFFKQIYKILRKQLKQKTPVVFIFSKGDTDILNTKRIQKNTKFLKNNIKKIINSKDFDFYITSIFDITTVLRSFSSGISKLSPNKPLIDHNLQKFSKKLKISIALLLSDEGLVLADFYSKDVKEIIDQKSKEIIQDAFEITAPQFAMLYKIFNNFKALQKNEALFKIENSNILLKRVKLLKTNIFFLFLIENIEKKEQIDQLLPDFTNRIKDLLTTYIS